MKTTLLAWIITLGLIFHSTAQVERAETRITTQIINHQASSISAQLQQPEPTKVEPKAPPNQGKPTRVPRPTPTPRPIPPPSNPSDANLMIAFGVLVVIVILVGVWINRRYTT
jgi:hypothetical protein